MKTTKLLSLLGLALLLAFVACDKDDDNEPAKKVYTGIYFMDTYNEDIETLPIGGGTPSVLKTDVYGTGIAYDKLHEQIYYSDYADDSTPNGKIWKMNLDGTNAIAIVSGIYDPRPVALDVNSGKVYWGDGNGNVSRCNLDGTVVENIFELENGAVRAVALDLTNNKLYFYEVNNNNLYKANLDGSNATVILEGYYGYGIAVDEEHSKIYFDVQTDDETISALYYANLDGSNPTSIDDTQSQIYGIAIDNENDKVYWSGRDTYEIYSANLNGTGKTVLATDLGMPRGIFLKY